MLNKLIGGILIAVIAATVSGCSLSSDLFKMDDTEDYEAYAQKWAPVENLREDAFVAVQRVAKADLDNHDFAW